MAVMRLLVRTFALFGLVLGLAAAIALHSLPALLIGQGSFFTYAAPGSLSAETRSASTWNGRRRCSPSAGSASSSALASLPSWPGGAGA